MKSRQDLIERVLEEVGVPAPASSEDTQTIEREIDPVMHDLAERGIYQWGDPDEFEDAPFIHLAKIIANSKARPFGLTPDENVRLMAERRLRQLQPTILSGQRQEVEYY